ncbi:flagellin [Tardiphaga sp.]|uniref:flagellin N-terminal helical domain-containing protein n=1 Tax=Tardiphaga sp. TaxID=1926292 RepID=UPI0025DE19D8|nr:flagellin [Tardiphaga sp.]
MSGITLTSAVRQNLLSLQSTASLLSETQNKLSTGNKVNSALDNPTNFFTASSLNSRSSDINNLLDGIGNGVQILQAANTGITSIQKLVDSAKSIANQALQTTVGYVKSSITSVANATSTASNLLGTATPTTATFTGSAATNRLNTPAAITGATTLSGAVNSDSLSTAFAAGDTLTINGQTLSFTASGASGANQIDITDTVTSLLGKINGLTGGSGSSVSGGKLLIDTGTTSDLSITSSNAGALAALGLGTGVTQARTPGVPALQGKTLTIGATGGGAATSITFGSSAGQVSTLDGLNSALSANNLQASLDTTGKLTITTTNDTASSNIGTIGGTASTTSSIGFNGQSVVNAVKDPTSQATRASLITQYNQVIDQITTTAQDSSFNGVNLLNGDTLKLTFNETGTSKLSIAGVGFGPGGLGLSKLTAGTDFTDNAAANKTLATLTTAATSLRSQASSFGSNLSVVEIRKDFAKSLINVLQTGASNLTLADTNEEAANSQALSTRQSIGVSALSLANTAQQGVLQLLR